MYDIIVVGSGFTGGVIAYLAATRENKKVLLLEKRSHIAGNMYDETDAETGVRVQRYGPHSIYTDSETIHSLLTEIDEWMPQINIGKAVIQGKSVTSPFNFYVIDAFFDVETANEMKARMMREFEYAKSTTIVAMCQSKDPYIKQLADFLFANDYYPYTTKQWGISPEKLDISILQRAPFRLSYIDQARKEKYLTIPVHGFTCFFNKMLSHPNIEVQQDCDACKRLVLDAAQGVVRLIGAEDAERIPIVYTGALDELFEDCFGKLPYRSLYFEYRVFPTDSYQEVGCVVHPQAVGYTRTTEYAKLPNQPTHGKTVVAFEYPCAYGSLRGKLPFYPILTMDSADIYARYLTEAARYRNLIPCGRLGDFKYYDMDDAIARAIEVWEAMSGRRL